MEKKVYSVRKKKDTEEHHIFECTPTSENKCMCSTKSICKKMDKSDEEKTLFSCLPEDRARFEAAKVGRAVCGTCVSHLYESY
jgi:hypothetical protein